MAERSAHDELADRVGWWAEAFALQHWALAVAANADDRQLGDTTSARLHRTDYYDEATIMLRGGRTPKGIFALDALAPEMDESVVHELLHLLFDDLTRASDDMIRLLPPKVADVMGDRMRQREEQIVERLCRIIVGLTRWQGTIGNDRPPVPFGVRAEPGVLDLLADQEPEPDGPADIPDADAPRK